MPPIPSKETGDRRPGPPASSSVLGGKRKLFLEDGMLQYAVTYPRALGGGPR